ncbi:hypothetical protein BDAP_001476 [Binucleata daphniae]
MLQNNWQHNKNQLYEFCKKQKIDEQTTYNENKHIIQYLQNVIKDEKFSYSTWIENITNDVNYKKLMNELPNNTFICEIENIRDEKELIKACERYKNNVKKYELDLIKLKNKYDNETDEDLVREYMIYKEYCSMKNTKENMVKYINNTLVNEIQMMYNNKIKCKSYKKRLIDKRLIDVRTNKNNVTQTTVDDDSDTHKNVQKKIDACNKKNRLYKSNITKHIKFGVFLLLEKIKLLNPFALIYGCIQEKEILGCYNKQINDLMRIITMLILNKK